MRESLGFRQTALRIGDRQPLASGKRCLEALDLDGRERLISGLRHSYRRSQIWGVGGEGQSCRIPLGKVIILEVSLEASPEAPGS
ncbi:MAG: hypothetical protein LH702_01155 [Phormidesmis sp. CAN_BIN44]|nr:hypothetical protein [Phormidesmis sp. CAN_BIN44]